jgi:hypothetical protein
VSRFIRGVTFRDGVESSTTPAQTADDHRRHPDPPALLALTTIASIVAME